MVMADKICMLKTTDFLKSYYLLPGVYEACLSY